MLVPDYDFDFIDKLIDYELEQRSKTGVRDRKATRERDADRVGTGQDPRRRSQSRSRDRSKRHRSEDRVDERRRDDEKRQRQATDRSSKHDRSQREDSSVMVMGLHPNVGDRDVYEFFSKEAGKVRDVYVIRDQRTGKSKGVAYIEFYLHDSILKALACNGRTIKGNPIRVQASGAEKNRAAEAQKAEQIQQQDKPVTLYILGLSGPLTAINEDDLKLLFSPFGDIDYVDIGRCPYTQRNRGFAYLQFSRAADAREAMSCLNGFDLGGFVVQVGYLARSLGAETSSRSSPHDDDDEYVRSSHQRAQVMQSLNNS